MEMEIFLFILFFFRLALIYFMAVGFASLTAMLLILLFGSSFRKRIARTPVPASGSAMLSWFLLHAFSTRTEMSLFSFMTGL